VLWRLRQEDLEFEAGLGYIGRLCLKKVRRSVKYMETDCSMVFAGGWEG
jgi:hypothetical protein